MGYLFWDTERIKGSEIYMLAYIHTDENFSVLKEEIIINQSVDISQRHSPKSKVNRLMEQSTLVPTYDGIAEIMLPLFSTTESVCFGKDDFSAMNINLKRIGRDLPKGMFYNLEEYVRTLGVELPTNLNMVAKFLNVKHDRHNPLSDSYVTMEFFKYLLQKFPKEDMKRKIPSKV